MEAVLVREARPWPPRRVATAIAGVVVLFVLTSGANAGWSAYREHQATSASCAALARTVPGLEPKTWATVLTSWHGFPSADRGGITAAVRFQATDPADLFADVEDEVRPAVLYLHARIRLGPTPDVLDIRAVEYVEDLKSYLIEECGVDV